MQCLCILCKEVFSVCADVILGNWSRYETSHGDQRHTGQKILEVLTLWMRRVSSKGDVYSKKRIYSTNVSLTYAGPLIHYLVQGKYLALFMTHIITIDSCSKHSNLLKTWFVSHLLGDKRWRGVVAPLQFQVPTRSSMMHMWILTRPPKQTFWLGNLAMINWNNIVSR